MITVLSSVLLALALAACAACAAAADAAAALVPADTFTVGPLATPLIEPLPVVWKLVALATCSAATKMFPADRTPRGPGVDRAARRDQEDVGRRGGGIGLERRDTGCARPRQPPDRLRCRRSGRSKPRSAENWPRSSAPGRH